MASTLKKARVLSPIEVNGETLKPNNVIEGTAQQIKLFGDSVDANKEAVNYCIETFDVEPVSLAVKGVDGIDPDDSEPNDSEPNDSDPDDSEPNDSGSDENQDGDDSTESNE